jgi:hypothetical protein
VCDRAPHGVPHHGFRVSGDFVGLLADRGSEREDHLPVSLKRRFLAALENPSIPGGYLGGGPPMPIAIGLNGTGVPVILSLASLTTFVSTMVESLPSCLIRP